MPEILDSGARREFVTGAVRDIQEGKGRCDLLPLDVIAHMIGLDEPTDTVLININSFIRDGNPDSLLCAIYHFCRQRDMDIPTAMLEVAKHYEEGAKKYNERNWEKGISLHCYIDSGVRHYLKCRRGDTDEPHDRAFIWNMLGAVWTYKHKPECNDLPFALNQKCVALETENEREVFKEKAFKSTSKIETCFG